MKSNQFWYNSKHIQTHFSYQTISDVTSLTKYWLSAMYSAFCKQILIALDISFFCESGGIAKVNIDLRSALKNAQLSWKWDSFLESFHPVCGIWWKWSIKFGTMTKKTIFDTISKNREMMILKWSIFISFWNQYYHSNHEIEFSPLTMKDDLSKQV